MAVLSSFRDRFDGVAFDAAKWYTYTANGGTVTMSGGKAISTLAASTSGSEADISSMATDLDLTGSYAQVQVKQVAPGSNSFTEFRLIHTPDYTNEIYIQRWTDGNIYGVVITSGAGQTYNSGGSLAYSAATQWWRIRESGGTIYFDYSADGLFWTNFGSTSLPAFSITSFRADCMAYETSSDAGAGAAWFANFNVIPNRGLGGPPRISGGSGMSVSDRTW